MPGSAWYNVDVKDMRASGLLPLLHSVVLISGNNVNWSFSASCPSDGLDSLFLSIFCPRAGRAPFTAGGNATPFTFSLPVK